MTLAQRKKLAAAIARELNERGQLVLSTRIDKWVEQYEEIEATIAEVIARNQPRKAKVKK